MLDDVFNFVTHLTRHMCNEGDQLGTEQEIEVWPCKQVLYAQPIFSLEE